MTLQDYFEKAAKNFAGLSGGHIQAALGVQTLAGADLSPAPETILSSPAVPAYAMPRPAQQGLNQLCPPRKTGRIAFELSKCRQVNSLHFGVGCCRAGVRIIKWDKAVWRIR